MIAAAGGWRALFSENETLVSRSVAFWACDDEAGPFGVIADRAGALCAAPTVPGFVGYIATDDDPRQVLAAAQERDGATAPAPDVPKEATG